MPNTIRKRTRVAPNPDKLSPDKREEVTVKEIVKDERTYKIAGTLSLLISLFLFLSFTSYLFTWQDDQDKVHQFGLKIFGLDDVPVSNLLGVLGAYIAHSFIYKGFGIASFLFCSFFFALGINLLFGRKVFSLKRNVKYVFTGLLVISVSLAFILRNSQFSYGGAFGELINDWLIKLIGVVGTAALLLVTGLSYFIWKFNPTFALPSRKTSPAKVAEKIIANESGKETRVSVEGLGSGNIENGNGSHLDVEKNIAASNNKLKKEGKGIVVLVPENEV
ncbi:MAG TPA: DNA translocase FtsK 4TM domain-containing protein, partial [Segetibacter sp.]